MRRADVRPGGRQRVEVLAAGRAPRVEHEASRQTQPGQGRRIQRDGVEERRGDTVGHDADLGQPKQVPGLPRGELRDADDCRRAAQLGRCGANRRRLVAEAPGHHVVQGDDIDRSGRQLEGGPMHDRPWRIDDSTHRRPGTSTRAGQPPHRQPTGARQVGPHRPEDQPVHLPTRVHLAQGALGAGGQLLLIALRAHRRGSGGAGEDEARHDRLSGRGRGWWPS